jgi:hypothetical protein
MIQNIRDFPLKKREKKNEKSSNIPPPISLIFFSSQGYFGNLKSPSGLEGIEVEMN